MAVESLDMHLQLNTSAPDPIGFGSVSGFYGPGAWAGWFLTLCASWTRVSSTEGFDATTWLYLLGMDWAALDLLKHYYALHSAWKAGDKNYTKEAAIVGASFTVCFWGLLHAVIQLWIWYRLTVRKTQRGLTLILGSVLPAFALATVGWTLMMEGDTASLEITRNIPALYFNGMQASSERNPATQEFGPSPTSHDIQVTFAGAFGAWALLFYAFVLYRLFRKSPGWRDFTAVMNWIPSFDMSRIRNDFELRRRIARGLYIAFIAWLVIAVFVGDKLFPAWIWFMPFWVLCFVIGVPTLTLINCSFLSIVYILKAYFHLGSSVSQSCVYMPCAPQSISELDQAAALLAGLFSFFIGEILVPFIRTVREKKDEEVTFEREVAGIFEMQALSSTNPRTPRPMNGPPSDAVLTSRAQSNGNRSDNAADYQDVVIEPSRRVGTGIELEEGRAGDWRVRRMNSATLAE
ncbi:hypothetical protein BCR34DRAFT_585668 [Clohesyomyces aquaticus]|uniref:Uncharacterized protein n=1 Tax=Clohesyomyces aquaticus TaxID=1231657 RepID=A0A1Y1ZXB1_9PLEO|nr:hypothetical protein BCR34DRAFT_585668 [Clohesyomyces aquaticus]